MKKTLLFFSAVFVLIFIFFFYSVNQIKEVPQTKELAGNISTTTINTVSVIQSTPHVISVNSEPQFDSSKNTMLISDDFNNANANLDYQTGGEYLLSVPLNTKIDLGAGVGGSNALRFDWIPKGDCHDDSRQIEHSFTPSSEIYVQFWVKYQPGFIFDWVFSGKSPCIGTAKKLFLIWPTNDIGSRFIYIAGNHVLGAGSDYEEAINQPHLLDQNTGNDISLAQYADGNWHRVTFHIKQSSTRTANDGFVYGWIDGVLRWNKPNWASGSTGGYYTFKAPATFNQGSPVNQSEWMDNLKIWK